MTAKTTAERQAAYRQRKAHAGETEVRGIYARPDLHTAIKAQAKLARKRKPASA